MPASAVTARKQAASDAPRVDLTKKLPYGPGRLKAADIKRRLVPPSSMNVWPPNVPPKRSNRLATPSYHESVFINAESL
jgi:hypothetical protein